MPTFDTPAPISVTVDLTVGHVRIDADDRTETTVEVRPSDPTKELDVRAAEQTRVSYADGKLLIRTPKLRPMFSSKVGSIDVAVTLPSGSQLHGDAASAEFAVEGRLGETRLKTALGHIQLDRTGPAQLHTSSGKVTVGAITGRAEVTTHSGAVRIGGIDGPAVIKNSNGDSVLGEVTGDLRLHVANGDIELRRALADVTAKTANGNIRIHEVVRGSVVLDAVAGELELGIRTGTAAWLDLSSTAGRVHNALDAAEGPAESDETVRVRARTVTGDIVVRRAVPAPQQ
ncbi:DUF4097 family beta strand repeat-containing protein [Plantactinospora sp. WMMB782]|uniref:DUF4097 family beta strand repeat-containing protein n=1 Tax=Plantactinospora sp. WMMB782 TaxID=3404121 RepID=UPI003B95216A